MSAVPSRWPWWVQVLIVYGAARLVTAGIFLAVAGTQEANLWTPAAPSYLEYTSRMWDSEWYRGIAEGGYPDGLPRGADGSVTQNAWAFFPLYPAMVRAAMATGVTWEVAAPTLSLLLGAAAMLVVYQVVAYRVVATSRGGAAEPEAWSTASEVPSAAVAQNPWARLPLATVAVLATFASAPVLQVAYTEALGLLLLATVLWCLQRRYYLPAIPVVLALGMTRAVALPVAVAVLAHAVLANNAPANNALANDDVTVVRSGGPGPTRGRSRAPVTRGWSGGAVLLLGASVIAGLLWPLAVAAGTGEPLAYTQTQGAWRGRGEVVPLVPWFDVARWLFGTPGLVLLAVLVAAAALIVASPTMRSLGPELQWWTAGYLGYLLLAVEPGTSLVRFGLLAFPIAAVVAGWALHRRWWRAALTLVLAGGVVGQIGWIGLLWRLVPPSGWPP